MSINVAFENNKYFGARLLYKYNSALILDAKLRFSLTIPFHRPKTTRYLRILTLAQYLHFMALKPVLYLVVFKTAWFYIPNKTKTITHRLNMELDLESLFGLLCTAELIG
jgi:hypothetical protein